VYVTLAQCASATTRIRARDTASELRYVSSLVLSQHAAVLAEGVPRVASVALPTGEEVAEYRIRRTIWGQERTVWSCGRSACGWRTSADSTTN
jgi:hypothetical protein